MYLFHSTNISSLKLILGDGFLKSYSLLKKINKVPKDNLGLGLYTENNFVYFSCVDKLFDDNIIGNVILYFNSKLLYNRSFYVSTVWSPYPNYLGEWNVKDKNGKKIKQYKKKYNRYYSKYNTVVKKLYEHSISVFKHFQYFQQVAIQNKVNLKELVAIEFIEGFENEKIINNISKYYPSIEIKISKMRSMDEIVFGKIK
jgi:hypothetical protein